MTSGAGKRVVLFGEMLLRLSTAAGGRGLAFADAFDVHVGGAEANVAAALSSLGHACGLVTALPDTPLGDRAVVHLRSFGVDTSLIRRGEGRLGVYYVDTGAALRPTRVVYDRADSLFSRTDWTGFDWSAALDGAALLHLSGISLAVSAPARAAAIAAMGAARARGVTVSFDGNFRPSLWAGRECEAAAAVSQALSMADIAFDDHRDATLVSGREVRAGEGTAALFDAFANLRIVAHTVRRTESVEVHRLAARVAMRDGGSALTAEQSIPYVVDRIGGGDAFAAGVIHGWLEGADAARMASTGLAAACLKHGQRGDALATSRALLDGFAQGYLDVRR